MVDLEHLSPLPRHLGEIPVTSSAARPGRGAFNGDAADDHDGDVDDVDDVGDVEDDGSSHVDDVLVITITTTLVMITTG